MLKDRSGVVADNAGHCQEDGTNCDRVGIKVRISVLECTVSVSVTGFFYQLNETTLFAALKFHCQSLSSLKDRFCRFHKAYLVLRC